MINLQGVSKYYGQLCAVDNIDLEIGPGVFGLLGPNGAGKTTLMRMLVGLTPASSGRIIIDDIEMNSKQNIDEVRKTLNYLPQVFGLYSNFTVGQIIDYFAGLWGKTKKLQTKKMTDRLLNIVGLFDKRNEKVKALSGGMKQRLGIAVTLINGPKVLIVDEPTAGLDPSERIRFRNFLSSLAGDRTIILSTHIVGDIESTCGKTALINKGRIVYCGGIESLVASVKGKVWTGAVDALESDNYYDRFKVASCVHSLGTAQLRIISIDSPGEGFTLVEPNLEEAYLYLI